MLWPLLPCWQQYPISLLGLANSVCFYRSWRCQMYYMYRFPSVIYCTIYWTLATINLMHLFIASKLNQFLAVTSSKSERRWRKQSKPIRAVRAHEKYLDEFVTLGNKWWDTGKTTALNLLCGVEFCLFASLPLKSLKYRSPWRPSLALSGGLTPRIRNVWEAVVLYGFHW